MQKIYCYVDESGQDAGAEYFVVVVVVSEGDQSHVREQFVSIEKETNVGQRKWHKSRRDRSRAYLQRVLDGRCVIIYAGWYRKPLPYFFPILHIIEEALQRQERNQYRARIFIDGIDRKKALEMTNALRLRGVVFDGIRGRRDESEPLIRCADRWAGYIRAVLHKKEYDALFERAKADGSLVIITKT